MAFREHNTKTAGFCSGFPFDFFIFARSVRLFVRIPLPTAFDQGGPARLGSISVLVFVEAEKSRTFGFEKSAGGSIRP